MDARNAVQWIVGVILLVVGVDSYAGANSIHTPKCPICKSIISAQKLQGPRVVQIYQKPEVPNHNLLRKEVIGTRKTMLILKHQEGVWRC